MRPPASGRFTASVKESVVHAIRSAVLSRADAIDLFGLSDEELDAWMRRYGAYGRAGLAVMKTQELRV